jgi:hypothetical protein
MLRRWLKEELPDSYHPCQRNITHVYLSQSQKEQAVIDLCSRSMSAREIAEKYNTTREMLYYWKDKLLPKEIPAYIWQKRRSQRLAKKPRP